MSHLILALALATTTAPADAARHIRDAITAGGIACGRGDPAGARATVEKELVLSYPGARDRGHDGLAAGYARLCKGAGEGTVESTGPEFEEVSVIGDVAVARLIWHTRLRGMPAGAVRKMRDFQVWRRTPQGWRFWRGAHWPYADDQPK